MCLFFKNLCKLFDMLQFIIFNNSTIQFNSIHWQYFLQILPRKPIVHAMPVNNVNTSYINVCRSSDKQDQSQMYMHTQLLISTQFTCWFLKCNWFAPQLNKTFSICYNSTVLVHCVHRTKYAAGLIHGWKRHHKQCVCVTIPVCRGYITVISD